MIMNKLILKKCGLAAAVALLSSAAYADTQTRAWDMKDAHSDDQQTFSGTQHPSAKNKDTKAAQIDSQQQTNDATIAEDRTQDDIYQRNQYGASDRSAMDSGMATAGSAESGDKSIVNFDFDSAELNEDAKQSLDRLVEQVKEKATPVSVSIEGYTDASGPEEYNQYLSEQRAESVKSYLENQDLEVSNWDVNAEGESSPIADNGTRDGREENRRAEVRLRESLSSR